MILENIIPKIQEKSVIILLAVNIYPIIGVLFFHWDYFIIVFLYIIETFIIGLVNILKMAKAEGSLSSENIKQLGIKTSDIPETKKMEENEGCLKFFLIPFFLVHYNIFVIVQGIFLFILTSTFDNKDFHLNNFMNLEFIFSIIFLLYSHLYSFQSNYIKNKEYKNTSIMILMFSPYKRIFIQQFTVIFGAFLIILTQAPIFFLIILIFAKTIFDLRAHFKIHSFF